MSTTQSSIRGHAALPKVKLTQKQKKLLLRAELEARAKELEGGEEEEEQKAVEVPAKVNISGKVKTTGKSNALGAVSTPGKVKGPVEVKNTAKADSTSKVNIGDKDLALSSANQPFITDFNQCPLTNMPDDKLKELLAIFLHRPVGIVPGLVRYHLTHLDPPTKITLPPYQWESQRQVAYDEEPLPRYDGSPQILKRRWTTLATPEDMALVTNGNATRTSYVGRWILPDTVDDRGVIYTHILQERGRFPAKVVHKCLVETTGLRHVVFLTTCKRLRVLGSEVLYSNSLVMNTRGQAPFTNTYAVHLRNAFRFDRHLIPGLPYPDGNSPSYVRTQEAINKMFTRNITTHRFLSRDPITAFFHHIGRDNAARITNLKIEGFMKTMEAGQNPQECPVSLLELLPIYTAILKHCCPNLEHLAIFQDAGAEFWSTPITGKSYEERVDDAIAKLVNNLPSLKVLEFKSATRKMLGKKQCRALGKSATEVNDPTLPWGSTLRWEGIVADRAEKAAEALRAKLEREEEDAAKEAKILEDQKKATEKFGTRAKAWKESKGKRVPGEILVAVTRPPVDASALGGADTVVDSGVDSGLGAGEEAVRIVVAPTFRKGQRGKPGSRKAKTGGEKSTS